MFVKRQNRGVKAPIVFYVIYAKLKYGNLNKPKQ